MEPFPSRCTTPRRAGRFGCIPVDVASGGAREWGQPPAFRVRPQLHRGLRRHGLAQRPAKAGPATVLEPVHGPAFTAFLSRRPPRPAAHVVQAASEPVLRLGEISAHGKSTGAAPFAFLPFQDCVAGCTPQRNDCGGDFVKQAGKEGWEHPRKVEAGEDPAAAGLRVRLFSLRA